MKKHTPDELVETEIERLNKSEAVKLARKERQLKLRRRRYLADLHWLEKRGNALMAEGWTAETLELLYREEEATESDYVDGQLRPVAQA
jgi:hypothetical protein